jgi:hypothetical protein
VIRAIERAIQLKAVYNIKVINLSLGRPIFESYKTDPLCREVEKAWLAGITVVVAGGNGGRDNSAGTNGYGTIAAPGNDPLVITVGALNTESTPKRADDLMTTYSSKGPTLIDHVAKPDLVAPGNRIFSIRVPNSTLETAEASKRGSAGRLRQVTGVRTSFELLHPERHQYGHRRRQRSRRCPARQQESHTRPGQGPSHEDRDAKLPADVRDRRPGDESEVHHPVRPLHCRRRIPRPERGARQHRNNSFEE